VQIWDVVTVEEPEMLNGHSDWVNSVAFSPDGTQIISGSDDNTVWLWDATTGEQLIENS
jgi:WD40 repeat protein